MLTPEPGSLEAALSGWASQLAAARQEAADLPANADKRLTAMILAGRHDSSGFDAELRRLDEAVATLEDRLEAGWRALSGAFDAAMRAADERGDGEEVRRLRWQRAEERRRGEALRQKLQQAARKVDVEARADAARALHAEAAALWDSAAHCSACGASFPTGAVFEPTDFRCPSCGQVHRAEPDETTRAYLAEDRVGAIAEESVLDELLAVETARRSYTGWLHPVEDDFVSFERTVKKAWNRWADAVAPLHPGWDEARARREAAARVDRTLGPWRNDAARDRRQLVTRGFRLLKEGRQREALDLAHASNMGASRFIEDVCVCLHEHDDRTSAWHGLALLHHVRRIAEDRDAWMRRRISEFDEALRTR